MQFGFLSLHFCICLALHSVATDALALLLLSLLLGLQSVPVWGFTNLENAARPGLAEAQAQAKAWHGLGTSICKYTYTNRSLSLYVFIIYIFCGNNFNYFCFMDQQTHTHTHMHTLTHTCTHTLTIWNKMAKISARHSIHKQ